MSRRRFTQDVIALATADRIRIARELQHIVPDFRFETLVNLDRGSQHIMPTGEKPGAVVARIEQQTGQLRLACGHLTPLRDQRCLSAGGNECQAENR